jgi:glycosidase
MMATISRIFGSIHPDFGTVEDFKALLDAAHERA